MPLFAETEETRRRREQTDRASAEIGRRLLQGWTMLGDECPSESCYYVPLVRPPRTGGEQDPRKVGSFNLPDPSFHLSIGMCTLR